MDMKYGDVLFRLSDQPLKLLRENRKQEITTGNTCDTQWLPSLLMLTVFDVSKMSVSEISVCPAL